MDIAESTAAAAAAAAKAAALICAGSIELDPYVARVDETKCSGCKVCLQACPFGAITRSDEARQTRVNEALCMGCGTCAALCPCNAIQQYGFDDRQIGAEIEALLEPEFEPAALPG
jgi:heterodisulfide reductase subunit A